MLEDGIYEVNIERGKEFWSKGNVIRKFVNGKYIHYNDEKGRLHNEDGPAVITGVSKSYFIHGELLTKRQWKKRIQSEGIEEESFMKVLMEFLKALTEFLNRSNKEAEKDET